MRLQVRLAFGQVDIWSDFGSDQHLVRCTPKDEALGQVNIWSDFRSGWYQVRCTPQDESLTQVDIQSDFRSGQHQVRCTPPPQSDLSEMLQKYFWSTVNYLTPQKISNKWIFKQLRAIWNWHFPLISIQMSDFGGLYLSYFWYFFTFFVWECLE